MPDLMKGTYNYKTLENKYGNFVVPAIKIKVGGTDIIKSMKLEIYDLKVILSIKTTGTAVIRIADAYEEKSHSFNKGIKSKLKLGTIVEIEMGYLSSTTKVFKGYVAMVGAEFEQFPLYVVTLMDARRLMMQSGKKQIFHDVKNYSDAFKTIMGNYSKLCSVEVDATNDKLEKPLSQTTNDYDFINMELVRRGKVDREFFILGDKAYFRKVHKVTSPIMTTKYGRELLSLKTDSQYLNMQVEVIGYDPLQQKAVSAKVSAKSSDSMTKVTSAADILTVTDADADNADKAKTRATYIANKEVYRMRRGSGSTIGLPEIVPGRYLEVKGLEAMVDNKYYLSEVTHIYNDKHFITKFDIEGWE